MSTTAQLEGRDTLRQALTAAGLPRVRVQADAEGWPVAPGVLGRIEWQGPEWDGSAGRLYVFTDRRRVRTPLLAIPGVEAQQVGTTEARGRLLATDGAAIQAVAALLRLRRRRAPMTAEQARKLGAGTAYRPTFGGKEPPLTSGTGDPMPAGG